MSNSYNRLLDKQLRKFLKEETVNSNPDLKQLMDVVNMSYNTYESNLSLSENAFQIASQEYEEINAKLKEKEKEIERGHEKMISSVYYAKKIQEAMFPEQAFLNFYFIDSFIFFKPKDIVSGDFYWAKKVDNKIIFAVADCTGHGVPGALISMLGISLLNEITSQRKEVSAAGILNELRESIKTSLKQVDMNSVQKDGMDVALCVLDTETNQLQYSGAYNPLYIVKLNRLVEVKASRQPISIYPKETLFTNSNIQLEKGDMLYLFSDGYYDQFNEKTRKKFNKTRFKRLLLENARKPLLEQREIIARNFIDWKGQSEQIDDILVLGLRVK